MSKEKESIFIAVFWSPKSHHAIGFRGPALSLTSENKVGKFDVLPEHTNFISLIFNRLVIETIDKKKIEYKFKRGVLEVSENIARVFLGI